VSLEVTVLEEIQFSPMIEHIKTIFLLKHSIQLFRSTAKICTVNTINTITNNKRTLRYEFEVGTSSIGTPKYPLSFRPAIVQNVTQDGFPTL
jgi:hypothetical protein